jgi:hypothetical protein
LSRKEKGGKGSKKRKSGLEDFSDIFLKNANNKIKLYFSL